MIKLYDKTYTTEYGSFDTLAEAFIEEERNGLFELSFIILNTDSLFNYIKEENIVIVNANDTLLNQKFRIYMTRKLMNNRVEVFARHISFDLMYDYIDDVSFENQSCEYALNQLFRNSNFSKHYKGYSDIVNAQDYSMSMANVLEAIGGKQGSIIDTFGTGAELLRDNENIHVLNRRGNDNGVTIEYRKNLTGFELEEDTTDLVTKILPYAKYNDENNGEVIVKADYVDSPLIGNYSHPYIASIDYSDKFKDDEIPTVSKLQELARKEYRDNKVDIPKQNFKIEFIPLSKCVGYEGLEDKISLCDTVTIIDTRYNVNTKAKVINTVFNVLKNRYESMELGEPRTSLGDIIGNGGDNEPIVGPPGPQGPPGQDGSVEDFPDILPSTPSVTTTVYGFANIEVSWTFENKIYYQYEVYASKEANFTPNTFNLIHQGQTSTFMYQAKPNEKWHFKVCAINSYGNRTSFGSASATTTKIEDLSNYVENMAIGEALIGTLSLDRGWIGKLNANLLDVKGNFSVTDGNGLRTLDIDSFGNVHIKASSFSLQGKNIATEEDIRKTVKSVDVMYYLSTSQTSLAGGTWTTTAPTWVNGKYMWSKTVTKYTDNTISESAPTCIAGAKGDTGLDGVGVSEIIEEYYLSNSNTSQTGGTWTTSVPTWSKGKFIWTRSKIIYTNSQIDYTTPICDSTWQAIDQQTQIDIFNKLTNNGAMQGKIG
ncbi:phage tail spike protein, partial [Romboutsia ilealis]|uniref:phage tail spike protein n=1 Tax=Romboutsia ilealis TaxID=1115758 RepID=UPI0025B73725